MTETEHRNAGVVGLQLRDVAALEHRTTTAGGELRAIAGDQGPTWLEGVAVPYGVPIRVAGGALETFAPGAFRASVLEWNARPDGARPAYLVRHLGEPAAAIAELVETPTALRFRARLLRDDRGALTQAARDVVAQVGAGINGASIEWDPVDTTPTGSGYVVRAAKLYAIAGAYAPAYDAARVQLRHQGGTTMHCQSCGQIHAPGATSCAPRVTDFGAELERRSRDAAAAVVAIPAAATAEARELNDDERRQLAEATTRRDALGHQLTAYQEAQLRTRAERAAVGATGPAIRTTRAELVYGPASGGAGAFLRDVYHAATSGDSEARGRLDRHYTMAADLLARAVVSSDVDTIPTQYMPGMFTPAIAAGRPMASFFQRVPITDAAPRTFARVTTSTTVAVQASQGANNAAGGFGTEPVTLTPTAYMGHVDVARQVIDGSDPAAASMILDDMQERYAEATEAALVAVLEAGGTASSYGIVAAEPHDYVKAALVAYKTARKIRAGGAFLPDAAYEGLVNQVDGAGRPMLPFLGPQNADGTVMVGADGGSILGIQIAQSWASNAGKAITARPSDAFYVESSLLSFTYDQPAGPAAVRMGVWGYFGAVVRKAEGVRVHTVS